MAEQEFQNRIAEARPKFLRRLAALQKSYKEFRNGVEFFEEFMELTSDDRLLTCKHYNGEYCNAWQRRTMASLGCRLNYEYVEGRYYLKDPGPTCAPCPLYEPREIK